MVAADPVANDGLTEALPISPEKWEFCRTYTEICVKSESQILPLGYAELSMREGKKREMEDKPAASMASLGALYQAGGAYPGRAKRYFDKAIECSPKRSRHLYLLQRAQFFRESSSTNDAIADLEAAIPLIKDYGFNYQPKARFLQMN